MHINRGDVFGYFTSYREFVNVAGNKVTKHGRVMILATRGYISVSIINVRDGAVIPVLL